MARALVRDPNILILDEATNSLDVLSEQFIQETLLRLGLHRTIVIIAHRFSTIECADHVVVLEEGHVQEEGRSDDLLRRDGLFARLYDAQYPTDPRHAFEPSA